MGKGGLDGRCDGCTEFDWMAFAAKWEKRRVVVSMENFKLNNLFFKERKWFCVAFGFSTSGRT